jgi:hypothetical protein
MCAARHREMHDVGYLVGQIPEAGGRVQADRRGRSASAHRHEIEVRSRWSINDPIHAA